jgi:2-oxoglutarate ferredoxin oxidoreductase subunit gamma
MIQRFLFSGTGGQGMITAAVVYARAALFGEGLNAVQTQVYGPEARGGSARSDVIVADSEIWFPKVLEPNVLICLSQMAYDRFSGLVRPGGVVVTDPYFVRRWQNANSREIDVPLHETMAELATKGGTSQQAINICLLGVLSNLIPVVSLEALRQAVTHAFDQRFRDANLRALDAGADLVTESVRTF